MLINFMSDDYKAGDIAFYHEMGEVLKVKVLANRSTKEEQRYRLRVLEIVQESRIVKPSKVGKEFEARASRVVGQSGWFMGYS